ncbi:MAG: hypothetical protein AABY27_02105 [Pseudomonadota bacterium]
MAPRELSIKIAYFVLLFICIDTGSALTDINIIRHTFDIFRGDDIKLKFFVDYHINNISINYSVYPLVNLPINLNYSSHELIIPPYSKNFYFYYPYYWDLPDSFLIDISITLENRTLNFSNVSINLIPPDFNFKPSIKPLNKVFYVTSNISTEAPKFSTKEEAKEIIRQIKLYQTPLTKKNIQKKVSAEKSPNVTNSTSPAYLLDLLLKRICSNETYREYDSILTNEGYTFLHIINDSKNDSIRLDFVYTLSKRKAYIEVTIVKDIMDFNLVKPKKPINLPVMIIMLVCVISLSLFGFFDFRKKKIGTSDKTLEISKFDHKKEALDILTKAKSEYSTNPILAFSLAGQSLRLFLTYEEGYEGNLTSQNILNKLAVHKDKKPKIEELLTVCEHVVFANRTHNEIEFNTHLKEIKAVINNG